MLEIVLKLSLGHRHDERLGQLEEPTRLGLDGLADPRAIGDRLERDRSRHREGLRDREDDLPVRLELGELDVALEDVGR